MKIETEFDIEVTFTVSGDYTLGEDDESVGFIGEDEVENVRVSLGKLNITNHLTEHELTSITEMFLDYCVECVGEER